MTDLTADNRGSGGSTRWDCIVIGAGPAGLTAALYMARYLRRVLVIHDETARALRIPLTHNAPGFPEGVTGPDLVSRMTDHAAQFGAVFAKTTITQARREAEGFVLSDSEGQSFTAQSLILATGIHLNQIPLDHHTHEAAIAAGVLRYCPVCDGYEHRGTKIGVIGCDTQGASEALFLRQFSDDVTLLPKHFAGLSGDERQTLAAAGIEVIEAAPNVYRPSETKIDIELVTGETVTFDVIYPALGCRPRTELAAMLGIEVNDAGCVAAGAPFETVVPGLYSAGDIVEGLDQINVAIAHGAIAATKAHNWLREQDGHTLQSATGT